MILNNRIALLFALNSLLLAGCSGNRNQQENNKEETQQTDVGGNYVTEAYKNRDEGYDWVAVKVKQPADSVLLVSIRSRADIKKPSCTFDATAFKVDDSNRFTAVVEGFDVFFRFDGDSLVVSGETEQDDQMLGYFCSGGGTIAGVYHKLQEPLDTAQIDKVIFRKNLNFGNYFFGAEVYNNTLTLKISGTETENKTFKQQIEGTVINAEAGDLNNDSLPEVFVYLQSAGSGSYGTVIGYSVIKNNDVIPLSLPNVAENAEAGKGYMGHDEFAIVENNLNQRFPVYLPGDSNANPTGGMRQIEYKLAESGGRPQLIVNNIVEY